LTHNLDRCLTVKTGWDYSQLMRQWFKLNGPNKRLEVWVWSFADEPAKARWEVGLNQLLYLMMNGAPGRVIDPLLDQLGQALFASTVNVLGRWEPATPDGDPPLGKDWGGQAVKKLHRQIATSPHRLEAVQELGPQYVRLKLRAQVVRLIIQLGLRLNTYPVWARGGQPEPDYEHPRTFADRAGEWENTLVHLPRFTAWVKLSDQGEYPITTQPVPDPSADSEQAVEQIRHASRARYGVDRDSIEQALRERVRVDDDHNQPDEETLIPASGPPLTGRQQQGGQRIHDKHDGDQTD
jgi:hypothetical protein